MAPSLLSYFSIILLCCGPLTCFLLAMPPNTDPLMHAYSWLDFFCSVHESLITETVMIIILIPFYVCINVCPDHGKCLVANI